VMHIQAAVAILRKRLFGSVVDGLITLVCAALIVRLAIPALNWLVLDATWTGTSRADCTGSGACWVFVKARFAQFMYGFYPPAERWRVNLAGFLVCGPIALLLWRGLPFRRGFAAAAVIVLPPLLFWLLAGGLGLVPVETREWGGLMLTVFISLYSALIAVPMGIVLALGRQSQLPVIRLLSIMFIEFWRGVPIIAVIFLASLLLPLILPQGVGIDRLARAVIGLGLVIAAYMAEAVRGGLQAIPKGQYEAADALGLSYWRKTRLIILPQALASVIPPLVNTFVGAFKDTSLVLIIGLFDLLTTANTAIQDPSWRGTSTEAYLFVALIYWAFCFFMSKYSQMLEADLNKGRRR
jgi:general L-amino acid transport system permease protein